MLIWITHHLLIITEVKLELVNYSETKTYDYVKNPFLKFDEETPVGNYKVNYK